KKTSHLNSIIHFCFHTYYDVGSPQIFAGRGGEAFFWKSPPKICFQTYCGVGSLQIFAGGGGESPRFLEAHLRYFIVDLIHFGGVFFAERKALVLGEEDVRSGAVPAVRIVGEELVDGGFEFAAVEVIAKHKKTSHLNSIIHFCFHTYYDVGSPQIFAGRGEICKY
ncbi:MAG: hypothetical protein II125_02965, partial [Ruminococcus sp.]|nr:hypothetical protein [Ruminococcus sp.]